MSAHGWSIIFQSGRFNQDLPDQSNSGWSRCLSHFIPILAGTGTLCGGETIGLVVLHDPTFSFAASPVLSSLGT
jgi:hypothetical protein